MSRKLQALKCVLLFLLVLGFQWILISLVNANFLPQWVQTKAYLPSQALFILISVLLMKSESASFREHGFSFPEGIDTFFAISVFLAALYALITVFFPGSIEGLEAFPAASLSFDSFTTAIGILTASIAVEIVFRGYIQTSLTKAYGIRPALLVNSLMSTLYLFSLPLYTPTDSTMLPYAALTLFAESIFLSLFFDKTKSLIPPIAFSASLSLLYNFTPVRATPAAYTPVILVATYIFLTPLMLLLVARRTR
jgi:membrane protease YdiL (CAAX protease family)